MCDIRNLDDVDLVYINSDEIASAVHNGKTVTYILKNGQTLNVNDGIKVHFDLQEFFKRKKK